MKQTKKMDNNYKEWLDAVTKNVASVLECSVKDAAILVEETNQAESLYDINTLVALASHEIVLEIRKAKSKIQLRGTFTLNQYIESQKVSAFCVDLELYIFGTKALDILIGVTNLPYLVTLLPINV